MFSFGQHQYRSAPVAAVSATVRRDKNGGGSGVIKTATAAGATKGTGRDAATSRPTFPWLQRPGPPAHATHGAISRYQSSGPYPSTRFHFS